MKKTFELIQKNSVYLCDTEDETNCKRYRKDRGFHLYKKPHIWGSGRKVYFVKSGHIYSQTIRHLRSSKNGFGIIINIFK